jgi:hypothetical protein
MKVFIVGIVVGIPMMAFSVRFALKPVVDAWLKIRESSLRPAPPPPAAELEALKLRVAALEAVWEHRLGSGTLKPTLPTQLVD